MKRQLNMGLEEETVKNVRRDALDLDLTVGDYAEIAFRYFMTVSEKTRRALVEKSRSGK